MRRDWLLADVFDKLAHTHPHSVGSLSVNISYVITSSSVGASTRLLRGDERGPQHGNTLRNHLYFQLVVLLEPFQELLQRRIALDLKPVPQSPLSLAILLLRRRNRLRETEEGQRQIHETVLVVLKLVLAVNQLVKFQANQTDSESSGCSDGRDNLSRDEFGLMPIGKGDAIVSGTQVGSGGDEVNVVIRVIILLEVNRLKSETSERSRRGKRRNNSFNVIFIYISPVSAIFCH